MKLKALQHLVSRVPDSSYRLHLQRWL